MQFKRPINVAKTRKTGIPTWVNSFQFLRANKLVLSVKLGYRPKNPVNPANLSAEALEEVENFLAAIDANDDVQNVYAALG